MLKIKTIRLYSRKNDELLEFTLSMVGDELLTYFDFNDEKIVDHRYKLDYNKTLEENIDMFMKHIQDVTAYKVVTGIETNL